MKSLAVFAALLGVLPFAGCTKTVYVVAPTSQASAPVLTNAPSTSTSVPSTSTAVTPPTSTPVPVQPAVQPMAPPPTLEACGTPAQCLRVVEDSLDPGSYTPSVPPASSAPVDAPRSPPTLASRPKLWTEIASYMARPHFQEWLNGDPFHPAGTISCPSAGYDVSTNYWGVTCELVDNDGHLYVRHIIYISDDCTTNPPTC